MIENKCTYWVKLSIFYLIQVIKLNTSETEYLQLQYELLLINIIYNNKITKLYMQKM